MSNETKTETKCRCGNCGWTGPGSALRCGLTEIEDFWSRVSPGDVVPDGECPECGGLAHAVETLGFCDSHAGLLAACRALIAAVDSKGGLGRRDVSPRQYPVGAPEWEELADAYSVAKVAVEIYDSWGGASRCPIGAVCNANSTPNA